MSTEEFEHMASELRMLALETARHWQCSDDEAEDVAQDSMIKLWLLRHDIQTPDYARRLITVVARHTQTDNWRHKAAHQTTPLPDDTTAESCETQPDEALEKRETAEWIEQRLATLPRTEYLVLKLRQEERLDNTQIALLLGIKPASVSTLLSRCRQRLLNDIRKRKKQEL